MQVILDSLFARPGFSSYMGGGGGRKESSGTGLCTSTVCYFNVNGKQTILQPKSNNNKILVIIFGKLGMHH